MASVRSSVGPKAVPLPARSMPMIDGTAIAWPVAFDNALPYDQTIALKLARPIRRCPHVPSRIFVGQFF
jgi:hypothetical protein